SAAVKGLRSAFVVRDESAVTHLKTLHATIQRFVASLLVQLDAIFCLPRLDHAPAFARVASQAATPKLLSGIHETNARQRNAAGRTARCHGRWPDTLRPFNRHPCAGTEKSPTLYGAQRAHRALARSGLRRRWRRTPWLPAAERNLQGILPRRPAAGQPRHARTAVR